MLNPTAASPEDGPHWLRAGFIMDDFATECQRVQGRPFLRTGVRPSVGQRVELTLSVAPATRALRHCENHLGDESDHGADDTLFPFFRLSGEVVSVRPSPTWKGAQDGSQNGANVNLRRVSMSSCESDDNDHNKYWRPAVSPEDCGPDGGSFVLSEHLSSISPLGEAGFVGSELNQVMARWDLLSSEVKGRLANVISNHFGALHGQEVVCEGRLNFDYDTRRGTEEGPWKDDIPFDGRDVWRFTLVADDSMDNIWRADPSSFVNLGRFRRARCWPWTSANVLPFERSGVSLPMHGPGPDGERIFVIFVNDLGSLNHK